MTVHMFRVFVGRGPMSLDDLTTRVDDWLQQNARWEGDSVTHELSERTTNLDGGGETFHALDVRFEREDTKANLQQKFADKLTEKVAWYRVGYHSCTHDSPDGGPCSWDDSTEWTAKDATIPDGVPTFDA